MSAKYWTAVILIGAGTFFYRFSFLGGRFNFTLPPLLKKGLEYVPVSVLSALAAGGFFLGPDKLPAASAPILITFCVSALLAWRFKRDLLTIAAGLAVFWLASYFLGG